MLPYGLVMRGPERALHSKSCSGDCGEHVGQETLKGYF